MVLAYFISYHTYGTWLHGHEEGSVDRRHNVPGTPYIPKRPAWQAYERELMRGDSVVFSDAQRDVVRIAIEGVAEYRSWRIHALNVRTTHVHIVVAASNKPERVMNDFKAWGTRRLAEAGLLGPGARVWARHGSTRYVNSEQSFAAACEYVLNMQ